MTSRTMLIAVCFGLALAACASEDSTESASDYSTQTNYDATWFPQSESDWDVVPVVQTFQAQTPSWAAEWIEDSSWDALRSGVSVSYTQEVEEVFGQGSKKMSVHITRLVVDLPYADFVAQLPVEDWGINLAHYLGGQVKVYDQDAQGRTTRQLERMVLSSMPCDFNSTLTNNDMTKVEVIEYGDNWGTVYWRVMHSDNNSTETDVGSVDFWGVDEEHTVITFHSAHRLNALGGIHIPSAVLMPALEKTFLDHARHYAELVSG